VRARPAVVVQRYRRRAISAIVVSNGIEFLATVSLTGCFLSDYNLRPCAWTSCKIPRRS